MTLLWENEKERRDVEHEVINLLARGGDKEFSSDQFAAGRHQAARTFSRGVIMDMIETNYRRLARAVVEGALYDMRIPTECAKCGGATGWLTNVRLNAEWAERDRARSFLTHNRSEIWADAAEIDPGELRTAAKAQFRKRRYICRAPREKRKRMCERLAITFDGSAGK